MSTQLRAAVTNVHRWAGLTVGLVAVYLAVTGGWIVLRPILDPLTYPKLLLIPACAKPLPVDTLVAAARAAHPLGRMTYVYLYGSPTASTMVRFSDTDQVYLDGCTGKVVGHQPRYAGLYGTVEALHKVRFLPSVAGLAIIGSVSAVLATFLVVFGLIAWWPRRSSAWRYALRFDRRLKGRAFALRTHTTTGVYASIVVFVVAATAVPLSLGWAKGALFALTGTADMTEDAHRAIAAQARVAADVTGAAPAQPMQSAWTTARGLVRGPLSWGSLHYLGKDGPIEIGIVERGAPHGDARNYVFVDPRSLKVVEFRPWSTLNAGSKLYYWALALHTGRAGGPVVQVLMLFGMIGLSALGYTGFESFARKTLRRSRGAVAGQRAVSLSFERETRVV